MHLDSQHKTCLVIASPPLSIESLLLMLSTCAAAVLNEACGCRRHG